MGRSLPYADFSQSVISDTDALDAILDVVCDVTAQDRNISPSVARALLMSGTQPTKTNAVLYARNQAAQNPNRKTEII